MPGGEVCVDAGKLARLAAFGEARGAIEREAADDLRGDFPEGRGD